MDLLKMKIKMNLGYCNIFFKGDFIFFLFNELSKIFFFYHNCINFFFYIFFIDIKL